MLPGSWDVRLLITDKTQALIWKSGWFEVNYGSNNSRKFNKKKKKRYKYQTNRDRKGQFLAMSHHNSRRLSGF